MAIAVADRRTRRAHDATLTLAVVGIGYWGPNLVRNLHELPVVGRIVACDLAPARLEAVRRRFPSVNATTGTRSASSSVTPS